MYRIRSGCMCECIVCQHVFMNVHVQGYTVVEDFFTPEELQPCRDAIAGMVDVLATKLHDAGKITGRHGRPSMLSFKY